MIDCTKETLLVSDDKAFYTLDVRDLLLKILLMVVILIFRGLLKIK